MPSNSFDRYLEKTRTLADINAAIAVLSWDQETYMPHGAAVARAEQIATLSTLSHQMTVADEYRAILDEVKVDAANGLLEEWEKAAVRESVREFEQASKLPEDHVRDFARAQSLAQHAWKEARDRSDFSIFADSLAHLVQLKRREAELFGYDENIYDALIDLYEPGMTVAQLRPVFQRLMEGTRVILARIRESGAEVSNDLLTRKFDPEKQISFAKETVAKLGFDFRTGRVDLSAHPFCTSFAPSDVRLTTRVFSNDLRSCLFGLIHEAGHGMYEQGIDARFVRTPLASGTSMGIHESQSLFWENMIGRSERFWQWAFPKLQNQFPESLAGATPSDFFRAINVVQPSFIRIEADEMTYNLHIIIRFEIENALINGEIEVADIPALWNRKMEEYLGIVPKNDAEGCLQDIHWSFGGFGYFPSYTLGKLYAAMFYDQAKKDLPGLEDEIASGEFGRLLGWLRANIHQHGKAKRSAELATAICGKLLTEEPFLAYMTAKVEKVYGLGELAGNDVAAESAPAGA
ncbi:MAG: Thermostable carboxypeptidase 1 [Chlorobi bacterium]|nr:Thermostable carboxypeptidase 1 [Chlorobiota bacterium]